MHAADNHGGTYSVGMHQRILMLCCVEQTLDCVAQRHGIRLIEMLPTGRPNQALWPIGSGRLVLKYANVAGTMVYLSPGMICGHVQIVRL